MRHQVAIVMTEVFLRRLTPSLTPFVRRNLDYRIISIHRPIEEIVSLLETLQPSGMITEWLPEVTDQLLGCLKDLPTVIVDTDFTYPGVVSIDVDDRAVGRLAAETFLRAGYRSVACLGNDLPYSDQRIEGFRSALDDSISLATLTERGFADARYSESFIRPSEDLEHWLRALPKPVGIFAVHDPLGRFVCGASQQLGFSIPDEIAVIGANNDELVCSLTLPKLSSVAIPWDALGALVGRSMEQLLKDDTKPPPEVNLIAPSGVVLRHSANHFSVDDNSLQRAMTYLFERMQDPINIAQMCDELRIGRRSLEKKFKEHLRSTPAEMLSQLRVNKAKQLLIETNHPVSLISDLCGFNDPERMAVVFKRVTGFPPSHHRRTVQNKNRRR